jgi:hypothetical protein
MPPMLLFTITIVCGLLVTAFAVFAGISRGRKLRS